MFPRHLAPLLALFFAFGPALAQDADQRFEQSFQAGLNGIQAGRFEEAIAAFETCLELRPEHSLSTYNIACCFALELQPDSAFEWLERASRRGFGDMGENIAHAQRDPDLAGLRDDPRFDAFISGMKVRKRELEEFQRSLESYWSAPEIYIPTRVDRSRPMPLLVVLHDAGGRKEEVVSGRWRRIADELGTALLAPSGKLATSREPGAGMNWFDSLEAYSQRYWVYERTISRAVNGFMQEHALDKQRVFLAGEGQGAMVAFNVALTAAGLYRGVLLLNGIPHLLLAQPRGMIAGRLGFQAHFVFEGSAGLDRVDPGLRVPRTRIAADLVNWRVRHRIEELPPDSTAERVERALIAALKAFAEGEPAKEEAPVK